jgi:hypothetical protein
VVVALAHCSARRGMRGELDAHIASLAAGQGLPGSRAATPAPPAGSGAEARPLVRLVTLVPSRPHTAALQLEVVPAAGGGPSKSVLLVASESHIEASGALGQAAGGRSTRRGQAGLRKQELGGLLEDVLAGGAVERGVVPM